MSRSDSLALEQGVSRVPDVLAEFLVELSRDHFGGVASGTADYRDCAECHEDREQAVDY